ncbi:MAG: tetratricopeptide repeat protein [Saprospiraceae bacterium]|nr:tetratricopeptide repeat protein [Saprospiraceae bacterium]
MRTLFFSICFLLVSVVAMGQQARLAEQYFQNGEYEKAGMLYERLYDESKNDYYFNRYVESLLALEQFQKAEEEVKNELKKRPGQIQLMVTYGNILERQYKDDEAEKAYKDAIEALPPDQFMVVKLANSFQQLTKYELAIETYEKGIKLLKNKAIFAYNLGNLYRQKGETPKMIENFLTSLESNPANITNLQALFQRSFTDADYDELQIQLYDKLQEDQDATPMIEMLAWVFVQKKDYRNALRQAIALDKRNNENGGRVFSLAAVAANDRAFDDAIRGYDYIVNEKGSNSSFYLDAKRQSLRVLRRKIVEGYDYSMEDLKGLELQYQTFLEEFGSNRATASIMMEWAELEGFYINDLEKAIAILNEVIEFPGLNEYVLGQAKIQLADFYLMEDEIWEATLLYSQVDKAHKDDQLGHEARFKNAKLSYYNGDFQWAQAQFSVLKASTSKLIANDALDLSVFIIDNLGLDTTPTALIMYSQADMLVFQNKFEEAFTKLDSIMEMFPEHSLEDDVLYLKAKIYAKKKEYDKSVEMYNAIIERFPEEIRADNALFELANLYENQLNDLEKAKGLYEKIFLDYSNSTFAVEARKRYRILRGDDIQ